MLMGRIYKFQIYLYFFPSGTNDFLCAGQVGHIGELSLGRPSPLDLSFYV